MPRSLDALAWLDCAAIGCPNGMAVDRRHLDNLAARGWHCPEHESEAH